MKDNLSVETVTATDALYLTDPVVKGLGKALQNKDWTASLKAVNELRDLLSTTQATTIVISSEDLSGGLVGRSGIRRVYPRLFENVKLLDDALSDEFTCTYYFFERDEDDWLRSVYNQNLKHRGSTTDFDRFTESVKGNRAWASVLRKVRNRLGDRFVVLPYSAYAEGSVVQRFVEAALPNVRIKSRDYSMYQSNRAPDPRIIQTLEVINRSHASAYAKRNARRYITVQTESVSNDSSSIPALDNDNSNPESQYTPDWPREALLSDKLPDELSPLWKRVKNRIHHQEQPNPVSYTHLTLPTTPYV